MPQVTGVRLRYSKTLWFSPADTEPVEGDIVIVSTERGQELGLVQNEPIEVESASLPAELKPVIRVATDEDLDYALELAEKEKEAMIVFRDMVEKSKLEMKPVDVEYVFGGDKIVFYFSAEGRVDFRALVKDLASRFHLRIDMRQIGVRDEARAVGGIGHCGEMLCCTRMGGEFAPVSIKMAKDQGLPLNPLKISGLCGRLMCCLRYEVEAYRDFNARSPRKNALIETPRGEGKVIDRDAVREIITLRFQNSDGPDDRIPIGLDKFSCCKKQDSPEGGCACPCAITKEDFDAATGVKDEEPDDLFMADIVFKNDIDNAPAKTPSKNNRQARGGRAAGSAQDQCAKTAATPEKPEKVATDSKDSKGESKGRSPKRRRGGSRRGGAGRSSKPDASAGSTPQAGGTTQSAPKVQPGERIPRRRNRD